MIQGQSIFTLREPASKRISWIDTAKFIGIFCVIYAHCRGSGDIVSYFYSFHLPIFFILNGMTLKVEGMDLGRFLVRKIRGYLIPLFFLDLLLTFNHLFLYPPESFKPGMDYFVNNMVGALQQVRFFPLWFVATLFVSDILTYLILRLVRGKLLLAIPVYAIELTLAITFNFYYQQWLMWNFDAAIFGTFFVFLGYLFMAPPLKRIRFFFFGSRSRSFCLSLVFLLPSLFLTNYLIQNYHTHLEMWAGTYSPYQIVIPLAVVFSFGICLFSAAITNSYLAELGTTTLVLLAFHQEFSMVLFQRFGFDLRSFLNVDWYYAHDVNNWHIDLYVLVEVVYCLVLQLPFHYFLVRTPLAVFLNKKVPLFYRDFRRRLPSPSSLFSSFRKKGKSLLHKKES